MQAPTTEDTGWAAEVRQAQATRTANVVCMKWGTRYGPEWVDRLYGMVMRNTSWNIRFVCLTDDGTGIRPEVEIKPLPEVKFDPAIGKYWPKLGLMHKDLGGPDAPLKGLTLFLDLDLLIIDSLDPLFEADGRFLIIQEWKDPHLGFGNSSVVRWCIGHEANVLERFYATPAEVIRDVYGYKEQNFLTKAVDDVTFWPTDWCVPFSHACLPRNRVVRFFSTPVPPAGGKILVFFGSITPESAMRGEHEVKKRVGQGFQLRLTQRRFKPAAWIADYWRA
jgi:hypothetical protein